MVHFTYILYSETADLFYIGHTRDVDQRLNQHNTSPFHSFTSKYRPWALYWTFELPNKAAAMRLEKYLKKKHRDFYERLVNDEQLNEYLNSRFTV